MRQPSRLVSHLLVAVLLGFALGATCRAAEVEDPAIDADPEILLDEGEGILTETTNLLLLLLEEVIAVDTTAGTKEVHDAMVDLEGEVEARIAEDPQSPYVDLLVGVLAGQKVWGLTDTLHPESLAPDHLEHSLAMLKEEADRALTALDRYLAGEDGTLAWRAHQFRARCLAAQKGIPEEVMKVYWEAWQAGSAPLEAEVEMAIINDLCQVRSVAKSWQDAGMWNTPFRARVLVNELIAGGPGKFRNTPQAQVTKTRYSSPFAQAEECIDALMKAPDPIDPQWFQAVIDWVESCDLHLADEGATPLRMFLGDLSSAEPPAVAALPAASLPETAFVTGLTNQYAIQRLMQGICARVSAQAGLIARERPDDPVLLALWRNLLSVMEGYQRAQVLRKDLRAVPANDIHSWGFVDLGLGEFHEYLIPAHRGILSCLLEGKDWGAICEALALAERDGLTMLDEGSLLGRDYNFSDQDSRRSAVINFRAQRCIDLLSDDFVAKRDDPVHPLSDQEADRQVTILVGLQQRYGCDREAFPFLLASEVEASESSIHPMNLSGEDRSTSRDEYFRMQAVRIMFNALARRPDAGKTWYRQARSAEQAYQGHLIALVTGDRIQLAKQVEQGLDGRVANADYLSMYINDDRLEKLKQAQALLDWLDGKGDFPWIHRFDASAEVRLQFATWEEALAVTVAKGAVVSTRFRLGLVRWALEDRRYADAQQQLTALVEGMTGWDLLEEPLAREALFLQRSGAVMMLAGAEAKRKAAEARPAAQDPKYDKKGDAKRDRK